MFKKIDTEALKKLHLPGYRDKINYNKYFSDNGEFVDVLMSLFKEELHCSALYDILDNLSWLIRGNRGADDSFYEGERDFIPTPLQENFQEYKDSWSRLALKNIPFKKWSDLAEEGANLLHVLITENKLENFKNDQRYRDFMKKFVQRHEDLRMTGEYPDLNELMDD